MIRNNKRALYEKIMRNVSREVKRVLNENDDMKVIPFDKLVTGDFKKENNYECLCKVNLSELIRNFKYGLSWIDNLDGYLKWLEDSGQNIQNMRVRRDYWYVYYCEVPEISEELMDKYGIDPYKYEENFNKSLPYLMDNYVP